MTPRPKAPTEAAIEKAVPITFRIALGAAGLPTPVREHRFHPTRKWRLDYAWPDQLVALEVEGGAYTRGRHTRGAGFIADMLKYSTAAAMGWAVIRCTPKDLCGTQTLGLVRQALKFETFTDAATEISYKVSTLGHQVLATLRSDAAFAAARSERIPPAKRRKPRRVA